MELRLGYIVILPWMREELDLKGNDLLIYALIHGFSQEVQGCFFGSLEYICRACGCTRNTAKNALKDLVERGLMKKREVFENNVRLCQYTALRGGAKFDPGQNLTPGQKLPGGGAKFDCEVGQNLPPIININNKTITKSVRVPAPLILPFSSPEFIATWEALREEKEWKKKTHNALQLALNKLGRYDEEFAIMLMEATIEGGWKGVVFNDTDAKYQEWKSARQQKADNAVPRGTQGQKKALPQNNRIDEFYRQKREQEEREQAELVARLKEKYGVTDDGNADKQASG